MKHSSVLPIAIFVTVFGVLASGYVAIKSVGPELARTSGRTQLAAVDLASNLLIHYAFDDNAGNTAVADSSGSGHNGTASTNTSGLSTAGKIGSAFLFDGTAQTVDTNYIWSAGDHNFTVALWFKTTASGTNHGLLSTYNGQPALIGLAFDNAARLTGTVWDSSRNQSAVTDPVTYTLDDGAWHHVALIQSGVTTSLYVDGTAVASNTNSSINGNFSDPSPRTMVIGQNFPGSVDDLRIYNRALGSDEVAQLYSGGGGAPAADTAPPVVSMSAPTTATTTAGVITLSATASDNIGVAGVQFKAGNNLLGSEVTSGSSGTYSTTWDSNSIANGTYSLIAVARDAAGNYATSSAVSMTVSNVFVDRTPPTVSNSTQSSFAAGTTQITMTVGTNETAACKYSDSSGVAYASMAHTFSTSNGSTHTATITGLSDGTSYTKYVRCQDTAGNPTVSDTNISFSVRTPVVSPSNAEVIGSEALQSFPDSAEYAGVVNYAPGNGETVTTDPPRFRWKYNPSLKDLACYNFVCPAWSPMKFIFQVDTDPSFGNPIVNVETFSNSYNFLAPLAHGATYYWRVGYIHPKSVSDAELSDNALAQDATRNQSGSMSALYAQADQWTLDANSWASDPYAWSGTRSFTVAQSATDWDRSMLASTSTMNTALGQHPNLLFTSSNRQTLYDWLHAKELVYLASNMSNMDDYTAGKTWNATKAHIAATLASSWWTSKTSPGGSAVSLGEAMFVYQMGLSPTASTADKALSDQILAADPATELVALANEYVSSAAQGTCGDYNQNERLGVIGYGYDWLYNILSAGQKAQVLNALEVSIKTRMYSGESGIFYEPSAQSRATHYCDTTGAYDGGHLVMTGPGSLFNGGESHSYLVFTGSIVPMLACYADSDACKQYFELAMNYMIGVTYAYSAEGAPNAAGYSVVHLLPADAGSALQATMAASLALPNAHLEKNPFWQQNADYWDHFAPVGSMSAPLPWTDYAQNMSYSFRQSVGWLAGYLQDQELATHWRNEGAVRNSSYSRSLYVYSDQYDFLPFMHAYPIPAGGAQTSQANVMYPYDGYAMGCSAPQSSASCFQSGLGYVFEAKPRGFAGSGNGGHSAFSDLSFELWAYGTSITAGGATSEGTPTELTWEYHPMQRNSILVNGLGETAQLPISNVPFYNRIYAYKNGPDYTYIAADGTNGYPTRPNVNNDDAHLQYNAISSDSQYYANSPLAGLQKVQRHFLFVRNKYWVVYDDLQSSVPYTYTWLWHVLANPITDVNALGSSLSLDASTASFSYSNNIKKFWQQFASLSSVGWRGGPGVTSLADQTSPPNVPVFVKQIQDPSTLTIDDRTGDNRQINPFTGEDYSADCGAGIPVSGIRCEVASYLPLGQDLRSDALWFNTKTPQTSYHFMTVVYPENPADKTAGKPDPKIKRIDDWTAEVTDPDGHTDVISFNPGTAPASTTILVDLSDLTPLPVTDTYTGTTQTSVPYVPPTDVSNGSSGGSTPAAPAISSLSATDVTSSGATISWTTNTLTSTQIDYDTTNAYGSHTTKVTNLTNSHSQDLTGLAPSTLYYYRVTSIDGSSQTVTSTGTFTTSAANSTPTTQPASNGGGGGGGGGGNSPAVPAISNINISGSASAGITVSWATNVAATSQVQYGLTTAYGSQTILDPAFVTAHSMKISNLLTNALYHVQIRSKDTYGTLVTSADLLAIISQGGTVSLGTPVSATNTNTPALNAPQNAPVISGSITTWLLIGTTNSQVTTLQKILNVSGFAVASSGIGSKGNESTYFGPATDAALKRFQCAKLQVCSGSLDVNGYGATGPRTRAALNALTGSVSSASAQTVPVAVQTSVASIAPTGSITAWLIIGTTNSQVKTLQQILNASGFSVALSGTGSSGHESTYFGPATDAALKRFQCAKLDVCSGAAYTTGYGATGPKTRAALDAK